MPPRRSFQFARADRRAAGASAPLLGRYLAPCTAPGRTGRRPGDRVFGPVERLIYRVLRVDQRARAALERLRALAARLQRRLGARPLRPAAAPGLAAPQPDGVPGVAPRWACNTAVSFVTNTNWQRYCGEATMSHLTQMVGLHGPELRVGRRRAWPSSSPSSAGIARRRRGTLGNFWVDLTRTTVRVLLPLVVRRSPCSSSARA